ncbi:hypothetical protein QN277_022246 [Acacia crassicarpa]|uniref:Acyl carrier protein n=1 Tax=Acacia crassicarpa TaxID=499986 RepID=A0AAE1JIQ8_9FABA|nr:hypothetical protein QN277_022246 [Acacia crassicarpa]
MASSVFSPSMTSLSFNSAFTSTNHRLINGLSTSGSSMFGGLRLVNKVQLQMATTRTFSLFGGFATKISCSTAQPETLQIVQITIAKQLSVDESTVTAQTKFADLGADSLDTVEIMMALEEKFGISIGEAGAENISTVQDAADLIEKVKAQS